MRSERSCQSQQWAGLLTTELEKVVMCGAISRQVCKFVGNNLHLTGMRVCPLAASLPSDIQWHSVEATLSNNQDKLVHGINVFDARLAVKNALHGFTIGTTNIFKDCARHQVKKGPGT